jgi:serine/threonine-protein kinase
VTVAAAEGTNGERPPLPATLRKGARLGRYVIDDVLGAGAMATVFRARDLQLGRTVALKVMNLAIAARSDAGERFRREAQAVAALKHPGIVEIHDFAAATEEDPSYIVAELIDGPTLRAFVDQRRGRLLPEVAALIAAQIADALAVAHDRGIVHRDVKPDNVMLEKRGKSARVVLTDFGVAHITGLETMTASGALVGSPAYMSPEQARGHDVGPPADLWAVGVLLYQMVTGTLPFPGKEAFAVIAAVARGTFKRASQVVAAVSPELDQIIARCLHATTSERYPSARALAEDLRRLGGEAGVAEELPALRRFLDDPEAFEAWLRPRVADAAVERARQHVRRGELARALNQVSRATAYVPDHRGADAVLRSISSRRRWMKGATIAGVTVALAAAGVGGWALFTRARPEASAPAPVVVSAATMAAPVPSAPPPRAEPAAPAEPPVPAAPSEPARGAVAPPPARTKPRLARKGTPRAEEAAAPVSAAASPPVPAVTATPPPPPPPAEEPRPASAAAPPATGTVVLRSSMALCHPSLDEHPISPTNTAVYENVLPGRHDVYCALTASGPKLKAGEINLRPDFKKFEKVIRVSDGRPHF